MSDNIWKWYRAKHSDKCENVLCRLRQPPGVGVGGGWGSDWLQPQDSRPRWSARFWLLQHQCYQQDHHEGVYAGPRWSKKKENLVCISFLVVFLHFTLVATEPYIALTSAHAHISEHILESTCRKNCLEKHLFDVFLCQWAVIICYFCKNIVPFMVWLQVYVHTCSLYNIFVPRVNALKRCSMSWMLQAKCYRFSCHPMPPTCSSQHLVVQAVHM